MCESKTFESLAAAFALAIDPPTDQDTGDSHGDHQPTYGESG